MVRTCSRKGEYDEVPETSTHHRGAFCPPVRQPSPPMPLVGLEQLLAPLNAIMHLVAINEHQVG
jgi:hypothetical protein